MAKRVVVLTMAAVCVASLAHAGFVIPAGQPVVSLYTEGTASAGGFNDGWFGGDEGWASVGPTPYAASHAVATNSNSVNYGTIFAEGTASVDFSVTTDQPESVATGYAESVFDLVFSVDDASTLTVCVGGEVVSSMGVIIDPTSSASVWLEDVSNPGVYLYDYSSLLSVGNGSFTGNWNLDPGVNYHLHGIANVGINTELLGGPIALEGVANANYSITVCTTPEPTTLSLLVLGLGGLVYRRVRRAA